MWLRETRDTATSRTLRTIIIAAMSQIPTSKALNLPLDIISEIFKNFSTPVAIDWQPKSFPWFLGQICARWRKVFLSMSAHFWGNIEIDVWGAKKPFPDSVASFERALDILNFCLKCNEGCLLSFSFKMGIHCVQEYAYVTDILDALIAQSMQWSKAELGLQVAEFQRLHQVKGHIPRLQSLAVAQVEFLHFTPNESIYERFADTFEDSPSLTHLQLYLSDIKGWKFDWSSIVVLRLNIWTNADYLVAVLSQSVRVEDLDVDWRNDSNSDSDSELIDIARSMITLSSLRKLTIHKNVCSVLGVLTAPSLEHLSLCSGGHVEAVTAFLRRSSCPLGHLELRYCLSPAVAAEVLSVIPGLPSLMIDEYNEDDGLIKLFNCNLPEGALLIGPRLKSLQVDFVEGLKQGGVVELSTMVASRAQNVEVDGLQELTFWADFCQGKVDLTILQSQCGEHDVKLIVGGRWEGDT
jgi:hypothetical protein